jgi:hypothetical protein
VYFFIIKMPFSEYPDESGLTAGMILMIAERMVFPGITEGAVISNPYIFSRYACGNSLIPVGKRKVYEKTGVIACMVIAFSRGAADCVNDLIPHLITAAAYARTAGHNDVPGD